MLMLWGWGGGSKLKKKLCPLVPQPMKLNTYNSINHPCKYIIPSSQYLLIFELKAVNYISLHKLDSPIQNCRLTY